VAHRTLKTLKIRRSVCHRPWRYINENTYRTY
jgi:hypothetical protein